MLKFKGEDKAKGKVSNFLKSFPVNPLTLSFRGLHYEGKKKNHLIQFL